MDWMWVEREKEGLRTVWAVAGLGKAWERQAGEEQHEQVWGPVTGELLGPLVAGSLSGVEEEDRIAGMILSLIN